MAKIDTIDVPKLIFPEAAAPATPASGKVIIYAKTDGLLYSKDDAGTETVVTGGGAGLGAWTDYTPALTATTTNPTLGSSTVSGRYKALDATTYVVQIAMSVTTGGAWNAGSGEYRFSLPAGVTSGTGEVAVGSVHVLDAGTARFAGICLVGQSATLIHPIVIADATGTRIMAHNVPVTWATGDTINIQVLIEAA